MGALAKEPWVAALGSLVFVDQAWSVVGGLEKFLEGYRTENFLDNSWSEYIPLILKRREIILYVAINRACDMNNLDDWCTWFMDGRKKIIDKCVPVLELDWSNFKLSD